MPEDANAREKKKDTQQMFRVFFRGVKVKVRVKAYNIYSSKHGKFSFHNKENHI